MKKECSVCISQMTERNIICCIYCEFLQCKECVKTYHKDNNKICCINCEKQWNRKFINSFGGKLTNYLINEKKGELLFAEQNALIPFSGDLVETRKNQLKIAAERKSLYDRLKELKNEKTKINKRLNELWSEQAHLNMKNTKQSVSVSQFRCPVNECNGIVKHGICVSCNTHICVKCREKKEVDHKCDEDILKTIELTKKDTKPCPSCMVPIYKVIGCQQMWCTNCKSFFDWNTLKILDAQHAHNPHFYDWQRIQYGNVPRNPLDIPCGELVRYVYPQSQKIRNIFIKYQEILDYDLRQYRVVNLTFENERVDFILNKINKKDFISQILRQRKKEDMSTDLYNLLTTYRDVMNETFIEYNKETYTNVLEQTTLKKINSITEYIMNEYEDIKKIYKSKALKLTSKLQYIKELSY